MKSYVKSLLLVIILSLSSISFAQFFGGNGSLGDPYLVGDPDGLYCVRFEPFASYIQVADIDFSTSMWSEMNMTSWEPIGTDFDPFIGTYDGNSYTISNLYIDQPSLMYMGLFGYLEGATLNSIQLLNVNIISGSNAGAIAGDATMSSTLQNCSSSGIIQGIDNIGGLVGHNSISSMISCYSVCNIEGGWSVGGLVGYNDGSLISDSYSQGDISGEDMTGGLIGGSNMASIVNCYSTGFTNANMGIPGGLIGFDNMSAFTDSFWDTETSGCASSVGGIGLPTELMKDPMTYMNWDFITPVWNIDSLNSGYPYLAWSIPQEPVNPFAGGSGTELDPYQIETAEHLNNVRDHLDSYFIQIADIDLGVAPWNEGGGWVPIGNMEPEKEFKGHYNGDHHKISNLFIQTPDPFMENIGLFGFCYGEMTNSTIENVLLDSANITAFKSVGGLVGYLYNGNVINCSSSGIVNGEQKVGGLIGFTENYSNISGSYSTCSVTSAYNFFMGESAGGLIGELSIESSLTDCYASGSVTGEYGVGGLVGYSGNNASIANCYSNGSVTANQGDGGGLVGYGEATTESNCYWDIDLSGQSISFWGTGKTFSEMHEQSTYETWDFTTPVWQMDPQLNYGYPYLAWSTPPVNNTPFAGGDGTEANPYLVATPTQLDSVRNHLTASFRQVADINLEEYLSIGNPGYNGGSFWVPIGDSNYMFSGNYNANSKEISGLQINRPSSTEPCGLFSQTDMGSKIENLYVSNIGSEIIRGNVITGTVVGNNNGTVYRCYTNSTVTGQAAVGGLIGFNFGTIEECCTTGSISGIDNIGGLVGDNQADILNSYSTSNVSGENYVAGLAGYGHGGVNSYSKGHIEGLQNIGGLTSQITIPSISCYWDMETSGQTTSAAGIGKTSLEMKDIATYVDWDFFIMDSLWTIDPYKNNGYPYLSWQNNITFSAPLNITTRIEGSYFVIEWDEIPGVLHYNVYSSDEPNGEFVLVSQEPFNSYGCTYSDRLKFFYVVAVFDE